MALDHTLGQPVFRTLLEPGGCTRWDYMVERLEAEPPFWKPGTRHGYHMISFGWTVGELVRRASGRSLGEFFRAEIAEPLGLDFWIGLPEEHEPRVAPVALAVPAPGTPLGEFTQAMLTQPQSIQALSVLNLGGFDPNSRACHAAQIGGAGGITHARGLAGMYAPLANGGELGSVKLVDRTTFERMRRVSSATHEDATLLLPMRFALGFVKSIDNRRRARGDRDSAIVSAAAFGHGGAGGSLGFADPEEGLSFGYTMNRMGLGVLLNERGQSLVDAVYRCLGYALEPERLLDALAAAPRQRASAGAQRVKISPRARNSAPRAEPRRQTSPILRLGTGAAKARSAMPLPARVSTSREVAGSSVMPSPFATIWTSVPRLVACTRPVSRAPAASQSASAWARRQCPSSSSTTGSPESAASVTGPCPRASRCAAGTASTNGSSKSGRLSRSSPSTGSASRSSSRSPSRRRARIRCVWSSRSNSSRPGYAARTAGSARGSR